MVISIQIESDNHVDATELLLLVRSVTQSMINNCNLSNDQTAKMESEKGRYQIQLTNDKHNLPK